MVPARLLFSFLGAASAMRPDARYATAQATRTAFDGILAKMRSGSADSLVALRDAEQISAELVSRERNATEHMSDDQVNLIREVIDVIRNSVYASMDSSHAEEQTELNDAVARIQKCNDEMAADIAGSGKAGQLLTTAAKHQSDFDRLQAEEDALTSSRDKALNSLTQHMSRAPAAPTASCTSLPKQEIPHWDIYFDSNDFVEWFQQEQQSYQEARSVHKQAEADLSAKMEELASVEAVLRSEYCAFTLVLEATCSSHDSCFEAAKVAFSETVERVKKAAEARAAAFEAGEKAIAHLKFLIGEAGAPDAGTVDSSKYHMNVPEVPAKLACEVAQPTWEDFLATACSSQACATFPKPAVIKNVHSGRRLFAQDSKSHEMGVGAMEAGPVHADQKWNIQPIGDGTCEYTIANSHSGRRLFAQSGKSWQSGVGGDAGKTIHADQKWAIEKAADGKSYTIRNVHSGRRLYARRGHSGEFEVGAAVGTVFEDQQWWIEQA